MVAYNLLLWPYALRTHAAAGPGQALCASCAGNLATITRVGVQLIAPPSCAPMLLQVLVKHGYTGPVNTPAWSRQPAFIQVSGVAGSCMLSWAR